MSNTDQPTFDFAAKLIRETELAFYVNDGIATHWLPKSKSKNNGNGTFSIPMWMASEKGIIKGKKIGAAVEDLFQERTDGNH